ncbi:hypothetical protein [Sabulibacter ruber]|uniref:hypothetical protein n=1 Tax=Sabulibacter ruber TaxID=2811901 RepID=UPI001A9712AE|nr:hypothetical protein [Sabulibacter ruber]
MRELVRNRIDAMQMEIIRKASNVEEVQAVLGIFTEMRALTDRLPEGGSSPNGKKRGRKPKEPQGE